MTRRGPGSQILRSYKPRDDRHARTANPDARHWVSDEPAEHDDLTHAGQARLLASIGVSPAEKHRPWTLPQLLVAIPPLIEDMRAG